jgi:hypothetical protein
VASPSLSSTGKGGKALPILLDKDQVTGNDSFVDRELKFARRWLYQKGVLVPEEDRNPVDIELESFFNDIKNGTRPKSDLEVGLHDSAAVMLANRCMYEERKVLFSEIDNMGKAEAKPAKKA